MVSKKKETNMRSRKISTIFCVVCLAGVLLYIICNYKWSASSCHPSITLWNRGSGPSETSLLRSPTNVHKETTKPKTLGALRRFVQQKLIVLQNPHNCTRARKLLCKIKVDWCGFGCQLHYIGMCFLLATGTNRTLVLNHELKSHPTIKSINEAYLPLSETCSHWSEEEFNKADNFEGDGDKETSGSKRVVKFFINDIFQPFTAFAPNTFPESLRDKLEPICEEPQVWWVGQLMTYITRAQPSLTKQIEELKQKIGFVHPIVGVHIRRTDKLQREAKFQSIEVYMDQVEKWLHKHQQENVSRRVFLATDDVSVHEEARKKYPSYTFVTLTHNTETAKAQRETEAGFWGIVQDLALLGECDHVVCTFSSNIGRLIHETLLANFDPNHATATSVDTNWFYPGQIGVYQAISDYKQEDPNGMQMMIGDNITNVRCQLMCNGFNTRTKKTAVFPPEKAKIIPQTAAYAIF